MRKSKIYIESKKWTTISPIFRVRSLSLSHTVLLSVCFAWLIPRLRLNRFCKRPVTPIAITLPSNNVHTNESKSTSASLESNRTNRILFAIVFFYSLHPLVGTPNTPSERFKARNSYKPMQMNGQPTKMLVYFFYRTLFLYLFLYIFINAFRFEWATCFWSIFQFA